MAAIGLIHNLLKIWNEDTDNFDKKRAKKFCKLDTATSTMFNDIVVYLLIERSYIHWTNENCIQPRS